MEKEKLWTVSFAIDGTGYATVKAKTEEEAEAKFREGVYEEDPKIEEWDINDAGYRGGYVDFMEEGPA